MDVAAFLDGLQNDPRYEDQVVAHHVIPGRPALTAELDPPLPELLRTALDRQGIAALYTHQVEAVTLARAKQDVVVVSGTASGKTLCYNLPVLEEILAHRGSRALYLFPLKALARDQLRKLQAFGLWESLRAAAYDGDTPEDERRTIRQAANLVLTNPDMLHLALLPNHTLWAELFANLKYVVIDEVHLYRGVFGSHAAHVFRRLLRLCERYGSHPCFIACSATIANPAELVSGLIGREDVRVVWQNGAPAGRRHVVVWNPPVMDRATGARRSGNIEATHLIAELVQAKIRTLAFTLARQEAELILRYLRAALEAVDGRLVEKVSAYRAGYLAEDRRAIEKRLAEGDLTAVVATVALEAGIDIGGLDATVMVGYPGTIAGFHQQLGRSGRGSRDSLGLLVTRSSVVDQYFAAHPDVLWSTPTEQALIDPSNVYILGGHLLCAAFEQPLDEHDVARFGPEAEALLPFFEEDGYLRQQGGRWFYAAAGVDHPAGSVSLRSADSLAYQLVDSTREEVLATEDGSRLWDVCYPGSVHLHDGEQYLVQAVDQAERQVRLQPVTVDWFTMPEIDTLVEVDAETETRAVGALTAGLGEVTVTKTTTGYRVLKYISFELLDTRSVECPPQSVETAALWLVPNEEVREFLTDHGCSAHAGLHAVEHALAQTLPLLAMCAHRDVQGASTAMSSVTPLQSLSMRSHTSGTAAPASHAPSPSGPHTRSPAQVPSGFVTSHSVAMLSEVPSALHAHTPSLRTHCLVCEPSPSTWSAHA
ncbi:MAG: DEAD/DEAH box helicase [Armatimonadetes bacterium]|nr:DEAD/DEAH box helicase [Armatimonadota bacterium]